MRVYTYNEIAAELKVSRETARRLFVNEPGVRLLGGNGSRKPVHRIPENVFERVLARNSRKPTPRT